MKPRRVRNVTVNNSNGFYVLNTRYIEAIVSKVLAALGKERVCEIDIVFMNDAAIRKLNKRYKKEDSPTDVLSFGIDGRQFGRKRVLGEIFISLDTTKRNSGLFGVKFEEELVRYVVHGILHLFGYDDVSREEKTRMWHRQEALLRKICRQENLSKVLTRR